MVRNKLPDARPLTGEQRVTIEVDYEVIIEWQQDGVGVLLRVDPTASYSAIEEAGKFEAEDGNTIEVRELPPKYQRQFKDTVRVVSEEYRLHGADGTCMCSTGKDGILLFKTYLQA